MGDDVKIVGNAGKDATITVDRNCNQPPCGANAPADKWIFSPVNFKFKAKVKFEYKEDGIGEGEGLTLTPLADVSASYKLTSVQEIKRGAIGKDAAKELKDHYNSIKPDQAPLMKDETAELIVTEWHNELKKSEWKTFFEKGITNALKTENLLQQKIMDYASHLYITQAHRKGVSFKGWDSFNRFEKEYTVEVNVGVDPVFLKTCSNKENRSRLSVSDPVLKECKTLLAGINQENEDLFSFHVQEPYETDDKGFEPGSPLQKVADADKFLEPQNRAWMQATAERLHREQYQQGLAAAAAGGNFFEYDEERQMINIGGNVGEARVGAEVMVMPNGENAWEARTDIWIGATFSVGENHFGLKRIGIGGKKASIAYGLSRIAANLTGWIDQIWKSWNRTKSEGNKVQQNADDLKDKTEEQADKGDEMVDKAGSVVDAANAAAGATSQSDMAGKLNAASNANSQAQSTATDMNAKEEAVRTNPEVSSATNQANVDKLLPTVSEVAEKIGNAQTLNNQGDLAGAKEVVTSQVIPKAQELLNESVAAQDRAISQDESAEAMQGVVKTIIDLQKSGPNGNEDAKDNMYKDAGLLQGSPKEAVDNIPNLVKAIEEVNRQKLGETIDQMINPALGPTEPAVPKETAVDKTDLKGDTPKIHTDQTDGGGKGGEGFKSATPETVDPLAISGTVGKTEKEEGQIGGHIPGEGYWIHSKNEGGFQGDAAEMVYKIGNESEKNKDLKDSAQNDSPVDTCWIAREVYGVEDGKWLEFRSWLLNSAPDFIRNSYIKYGQNIAKFIKNKPILKNIIKVWMDSKINAK